MNRQCTLALAAVALLCLAPPAPRKQPKLPPIPPIEFPRASRLELPIALVLDESYRKLSDAQRGQRMGDLADNTERLARSLFEPVTVVASALERTSEAATLQPRFVDSGYAVPLHDSQPRRSAVVVEWSFVDSAGCLVWIDTFLGRGEVGWQESFAKPTRLALEDVLRAAHRGISESPEIAAYAKRWLEQQAAPFVGPPAPGDCVAAVTGSAPPPQ